MTSVLVCDLLRRGCAVGLHVFVVRVDVIVTVRDCRWRWRRAPTGAAVSHVERGLLHGTVAGVSTSVFRLWLTNARVVRRLRRGDERNAARDHHAISAGQPAQEQ